MNDIISRQGAIGALVEKGQRSRRYKLGETWELNFDEIREALATVPSAEPQWILCSERMPEEHEWIGTKKFGTTISDKVYVTFESPKGERFCRHLCFENGKLSPPDQQTIDVWYKGSVPIAWMPFPKPYKGDK